MSKYFICPFCGGTDSRVKDVRPSEYGLKRRRRCTNCAETVTTYEMYEADLMMLKANGGKMEASNDSKNKT